MPILCFLLDWRALSPVHTAPLCDSTLLSRLRAPSKFPRIPKHLLCCCCRFAGNLLLNVVSGEHPAATFILAAARTCTPRFRLRLMTSSAMGPSGAASPNPKPRCTHYSVSAFMAMNEINVVIRRRWRKWRHSLSADDVAISASHIILTCIRSLCGRIPT